MKRQFTVSREELDGLAIDRAAKTVRDIFIVLEKSGHAAYVSVDGASGAAGLLAVAHAAYKEAMIEVEMEHEIPGIGRLTEADLAAFVTPNVAMAMPRASERLRPVPWPRPDDGGFPPVVPLHADVPRSAHAHNDGTPCECDPDCNCHPPVRNEDPIVTGERGSWHLDTCPVSPKNRGKAQL